MPSTVCAGASAANQWQSRRVRWDIFMRLTGIIRDLNEGRTWYCWIRGKLKAAVIGRGVLLGHHLFFRTARCSARWKGILGFSLMIVRHRRLMGPAPRNGAGVVIIGAGGTRLWR